MADEAGWRTTPGRDWSSAPPPAGAFARLLGVESPRRLGRALAALTLVGGPRQALVTSGLLWVLLYAGWETGTVDAEAAIWLSAGVVLAALQGLGRGPDACSSEANHHTPPEGYRRRPAGENRRRLG